MEVGDRVRCWGGKLGTILSIDIDEDGILVEVETDPYTRTHDGYTFCCTGSLYGIPDDFELIESVTSDWEKDGF